MFLWCSDLFRLCSAAKDATTTAAPAAAAIGKDSLRDLGGKGIRGAAASLGKVALEKDGYDASEPRAGGGGAFGGLRDQVAGRAAGAGSAGIARTQVARRSDDEDESAPRSLPVHHLETKPLPPNPPSPLQPVYQPPAQRQSSTSAHADPAQTIEVEEVLYEDDFDADDDDAVGGRDHAYGATGVVSGGAIVAAVAAAGRTNSESEAQLAAKMGEKSGMGSAGKGTAKRELDFTEALKDMSYATDSETEEQVRGVMVL